MTRRVVVTAMGAVSPLGGSVAELWHGLVAGCSGIRPISHFDAGSFRVTATGEARTVPLDPGGCACRAVDLLAVAAAEAGAQGRLAALPAGARVGVFASRIVEWPGVEELASWARARAGGASPAASPRLVQDRLGLPPVVLTGLLGLGGRPGTGEAIETACATGAMVVGEAFRAVRAGDLDIGIAAAASSWTNPVAIGVYQALNVLADGTGDPARASRPFDAMRTGFVMAEAAGVLVLETEEHARARGLEPLAVVAGYGVTTSAYRLSDMPPDGEPQARAMALALGDAGRTPADVDMVNAHGTATYQNDRAETLAIRRLLGARGDAVPVTANKSMIGHTVAAAGLVETIATVLSVREGVVPPTINLEHPDPECDLDYVPGRARRLPVALALNNSFGFGGQNCALAIEGV